MEPLSAGIPRFDSGSWIQWVIASFVGYWSGDVLAVLVYASGALSPSAGFLLSDSARGLLIGFFQWLIIRQRLSMSRWWIPVTVFGWGTSLFVSELLCPFLGEPAVWAIIGGTIGLCQWLLLCRDIPRISHSLLWIAANVIGVFAVYSMTVFTDTHIAHRDLHDLLAQFGLLSLSYILYATMTGTVLMSLHTHATE